MDRYIKALLPGATGLRRHSPPPWCDRSPQAFPSSWEEGLGVEEINMVTTYFTIGYDRF